MAKAIRDETKALIDSLQAVSAQATPVANALMLNQMPSEKQHLYADMLKSLSDLLHEHADSQERRAEAEGQER